MDNYYLAQAGSGLGGFSGHRYQKGDGFFGRLIAGTVLPLIKKALPFLGKAALNTGVDIVRDVAEGQKFKESLKKRVRKAGDHISERAMKKVKEITGGSRGVKGKKQITKTKEKKAASKSTKKSVPKSKKKGSSSTKGKSRRQSPRSKITASDFLR